MNFIANVRSAFTTEARDDSADRGVLVEGVIMMAGFAVVAMLVVNWLGQSITNLAADSATCIENANTYMSSKSNTCSKNKHAKENSFKNDAGYTSRY